MADGRGLKETRKKKKNQIPTETSLQSITQEDLKGQLQPKLTLKKKKNY